MVLGFWSRDKNDSSLRMKRFVKILCAALLLAVAGLAAWRIIPTSETFYTDADTIKQPVTHANIRDILWQPPTPLSELINTTADDYEPRLSADGLTLYFVRGKAGDNAEIYTSRKTYQGWSTPQPIKEINSEADDLGPQPSMDGESLYFYSNREGTFGGYDLWVARRDGDAWMVPVHLGANVNSPFNDYGPALTADGKTLYFSSNRPQPTDEKNPDPDAWSATLREDLFHRTYDLYVATINDRGVGEAAPIVELNTSYNEGAPAVTPFGDFLYFSSDRPGGEGDFDLYRSRNLHGGYRKATNLGLPINTAANELDPALAMGGYALYFSSDRREKVQTPGDIQADGARVNGAREGAISGRSTYHLFYSTSREVFADTRRTDRDPIDWAGLWGVIGPNLLWALLVLLLLLLLLSLYRAMRERKMSLLAKCLLASLAVHVLLLMLMNAWEVAAAIAGEFNRRGRIQVAIASPSSGDAIASQIRGELTAFALPDIVSPPPVERLATKTSPDVSVASVILAVDRRRMIEGAVPTESVAADDAANRPRSKPFAYERSVEIVPTMGALATRIPSDPSPMDTDEQPTQPQIEAGRFSGAMRANVNTPAPRDSARVDMNPTQTVVDFSRTSKPAIADPAIDLTESAAFETAFVESPVSQQAATSVDAKLIKPVTPHDELQNSKATEAPVREPAAKPARKGRRAELARVAMANQATSQTTHPLSMETSRAFLDDSMTSTIDLVPKPVDAAMAETTLVPDTSVPVAATPSMELANDLATPQAEQMAVSPTEKPVTPVKALPSESTRPSLSRDVATMADASFVSVESPVAPSDIPVSQMPESMTIVDAEAENSPAPPVDEVIVRDHTIPPPLFAAAMLALPAVDRGRSKDAEVAASKVDVAKVVFERLPAAVLASTALAAPNAPFTVSSAPSRVWRDRPIRNNKEDARPQEFAELPLQPPLDDLLQLPSAVAVSAELKLETIAEEIEPQLKSEDPWSDEIIGLIHGKISDKATGEPLAGGQVRLTLPFIGSIVAIADRRGRYTMNVPNVPEFFAVSATLDGYVPETKSVRRDRVEGRKLRVNFALTPQDRSILVTEAIPDVHHLGDNRFDGQINSQFQKESEGDHYQTTFTLQGDPLSPNVTDGEVVLLAKGVQRSHRIVINGETLDDRLDDAPSDGSFGEFVARFDVSILHAGENTLEIIAKPSSSDIDDFEFVNVRVRLMK